MKVVILAGGRGTRIGEESVLKPKPMVEIGGKPILWHIMKTYAYYGLTDFIICAGYKQDVIKQYFFDYYLHNADVAFDLATNTMQVLNSHAEPWKVTVVDTGLDTMTGGRIRRIKEYIGNETFLLTYGDAVSDVNIAKLIEFHKSHGRHMTLTTVSIAQQKGVLDIGSNNVITSFREKKDEDGAVINGGYMACNPALFDYLIDDTTVLEQAPMRRLAAEGQLMSFYHSGFWQCMDMKREKDLLEKIWSSGQAPWKIWEK